MHEALLAHLSVFIREIMFPDVPQLVFPYTPLAATFTILAARESEKTRVPVFSFCC